MKTVPFSDHEARPGVKINEVESNMRGNFTGTGKLEFCELFSKQARVRMMKVNTELMEESGIFKDDVIVIDPMGAFANGTIIVVKIDDSIMIRRVEKMKSGAMLYGDSNKISPLQIEEGYKNFKILGVVAFVIKRL